MLRITQAALGAALFSAAISVLFPRPARALPAGFTATAVATGLNVSFLRALDDGRVFVNEKHGVVRVIKDGKLLSAPLLDISAQVESAVERGLLGIEVDPDFASNGYLYLFYNGKDNHAYVGRYTVKGDVADPATGRKLFDLGAANSPYHHGGDVRFGPDGKLYVTQGNAGGYAGDVKVVSQEKNDMLGSLFRINADGTIPSDNPFYAQNTGNAKAVWTYGNRNSFNVRFQPGTGLCFFSDVQDANADDEINECKAGANYGYGGGSAAQAPVLAYGANGTAQIGAAWYSAAQFPSEYRGLFFFGNNGNGNIKTLDPKTKKAAVFHAFAADCPISLDVDGAGNLWAATRCGDAASTANGKVWKLTYPDGVTALGGGSRDAVPRRIDAARALAWTSPAPGMISVQLKRGGAQSLSLLRPDGSVVAAAEIPASPSLSASAATASPSGTRTATLRTGSAKGVFILAWKGGSDAAATKIMLE